jgi:hypothetical protein
MVRLTTAKGIFIVDPNEQIIRRVVTAASALQSALSLVPPEMLEACNHRPQFSSEHARRAVNKRWRRHRERVASLKGSQVILMVRPERSRRHRDLDSNYCDFEYVVL